MKKSRSGFTLVEISIVIVIIAILAGITVVSYKSIQARSRDAKRQTDVANIIKAMELYYSDTGSYPAPTGPTSSPVNPSWYSSGDSSRDMLSNLLTTANASGSRAIDVLPKDPKNPANASPFVHKGYTYGIFVSQNATPGGYCGTSSKGQMYLIVYRLESSKQEFRSEGPCTTNPLGKDYYDSKGVSIYRNVKSGS